MKKVILAPHIDKEDIVIEYTSTYKLDRSIYLNVPNNYEAIFISDDNFVAKFTSTKSSLLKLVGKEYKSTQIKIAFIKKDINASFSWGFGEIKINNPKLNISYMVGCNGKYSLDIINPYKLIKSFNKVDVTVSMLKDKTKPYIEPLARPIVAKYFLEKELNIYEMESYIDEIKNQISEELNKVDIFKDLGVKVKHFVVNTIHIPEEELNLLASKLEKLGQRNSNHEATFNSLSELEKVRKEIEYIKKELEEKDTDLLLDEIDNLRRELLDTLNRLSKEEQLKIEQDLKDINTRIDNLKS